MFNNAYESSPDGSAILFTINTTADYHLIEITNQGKIPHSIQKVFFEKYATEGKKTGTGLGTYSAKLIVEAHKGTISFTVAMDKPQYLSRLQITINALIST